MSSVRLSCPVCRVPTPWEGNDFRPFCSERCRLVDLGSWAGEAYRIPAEPLVDQDDSEV